MTQTKLPSAIEAERNLLGVLIRDSAPFPDTLKPSDFFEPKHQEVAAAIIGLNSQNTLHDELTVTTWLRASGSNVQAFEVSDLTSTVGFTMLNDAWAKLIKRTSTLRRFAQIADQMASLATDESSDPLAIATMVANSIDHTIKENAAQHGPERMQIESLLEFDRKSDPTNVLGYRWLCRGGSLLMVGQSGTGKSSLMTQACVSWTLGRNFFGIKCEKPLRSIVIQAENDLGDVAEGFQDICEGLMLSHDDKDQLKDRLQIYREAVATSDQFGKLMRQLVKAHSADIIFVDPLLAFAGIDISDQAEASHFLRHIIQPILNETGVIFVAMHHTGKPKSSKEKEGQTVADLAYSGLGSSELTNYFREVAVLARSPGEEPIYKFALTKRRGRAGMKDNNGDFTGEITIRHARERGVIRWERSMPPDHQDDEGSPKGSF